MHTQLKKKLCAAAVLIPFALVPGIPHAHKGATGVVKQRMDAMSEMGDAMGVMADMIKQKRPFDPGEVTTATRLLVEHTNQLIELFPDTAESRHGAATEALPSIWENWDSFTDSSQNLATKLATFQATAANGLNEQVLRQEFRKIAKACSGCHEDFRKPEE